MTESRLQLVTKFFKLLSIACLVAASVAISAAQGTNPPKPPSNIDDKHSANEPPTPIASIEEEMRAKRDIRMADKAHRENVVRANDLSFLSASIVSSFKQKNQLDREDLRKLEKVEKLAKSIRHAAGGSADEVELEEPPTELKSALIMFGEVSESLKTKVEKTPKHVISAAVIDEANVLLELIRFIRTIPATRNP